MRGKCAWPGGLVIGLCLCGGLVRAADARATHETVIKKFLVILDQVSDSLAQVKDQETAKKTTAALKKQTEQAQNLTRTLKGLGQPSQEQNDLVKKLEKNVKETVGRFGKEAKGLADKLHEIKLPAQTRNELRDAFLEFGRSLREFSDTVQEIDK